MTESKKCARQTYADTGLRLKLPWEKVAAFCRSREIKPESKELASLVREIHEDVQVLSCSSAEGLELILACGIISDAYTGDFDVFEASIQGNALERLLKLFSVDLQEVELTLHCYMSKP